MKRNRVAFRGLWPGFPWQGGFRYWAKDAARSIKELPHELRYFLERGWYGITWRDCWNLDQHLADIMPWAIRMLDSENNPMASSSTPGSLAYASELANSENKLLIEMSVKSLSAEWSRRLEMMARGFEAIREQEECLDAGEHKKLEEVIQSGLGEFVKYHSALWD